VTYGLQEINKQIRDEWYTIMSEEMMDENILMD